MPITAVGPTHQRRVVLTEEEYTATLSDIIQRDFYPQLSDLEREAAVLERRAVGDVAGAVAVRRAARRLALHEQFLADQELLEEELLLEQNVDRDDESKDDNSMKARTVTTATGITNLSLPQRRTARPLHRESLTGFHARVTSSDNAEFDQDQREQLQARRDHLDQVFQQSGSNRLALTAAAAAAANHQTPLLASDAFTASAHRITAAEWKAESNSLFFLPSALTASVDETNASPLLLTNSTTALATNSKASNAPSSTSEATNSLTLSLARELMPPPPNRKSHYGIGNQVQLVEYIPKHALEKKIEPSRTRFPSSEASLHTRRWHWEETDPNNNLVSLSTDYNSTDTAESASAASTDLDAPWPPLDQERRARQKRQRRERDLLVTMTPQLVPGRDGVDASPLITWGTVASTPLVLGAAATATLRNNSLVEEAAPGQPSFAFPVESQRDQHAAKAQAIMLEKARKRLSASSSRPTATTTPSSSSRLRRKPSSSTATPSRSSALTPSARSRDSFASALRASYTPQRTSNSSSGSSTTSKTPSALHQNSNSSITSTCSSRPGKLPTNGSLAPTKKAPCTIGVAHNITSATNSLRSPQSHSAAELLDHNENLTDGLLKLD